MLIIRTAIAGILALLTVAPAAAQVNLNNLPSQTVVGRLGTTTGPAQAIPFATLKAQLGVTVTSVAGLRNLAPGISDNVLVLGYYTVADGGGGTFIWNAASTATDNNGAIIAPGAGGTGRWIRQTAIPNEFTPEMFGAKADGTSDANAVDDLLTYLTTVPGSGTMQLSCGKTYTLANPTGTGPYGARGNGQSIIRLFSNVNIVGCGPSSIIKMANNTNTSGGFWYWGLYTTGTASNVRYADFTIDMNGANNSCGGTCYHSNAALGVAVGDNISVENIKFINNPGSNNTVFGQTVEPPSVTNLRMIGLVHEHNALSVNPAMLDWSGDFFIASNVTYSNIRHSDATGGTAFELHGTNITASDIVVTGHINCGIIASEPSERVSNLTLGDVTCTNVNSGIQVAAKTSATNTNVNIHDVILNLTTGTAGMGIDACSLMEALSVNNTNLVVSNITYRSDVVTNLGNESNAVAACRWASISIRNITTTNTQAGAVLIDQVVGNANIAISGVNATNPARTATAANQAVVIFRNTSGNAAQTINIANVTSSGTVQWNITGNVGANQTTIDPGSLAAGGTVAHVNWSGAQLSHVIFPVGSTNFRPTGGTGQFVKQASAGAAFTVSAPVISEIGGFATNCATWLGTSTSANLASCLTDETGTAGSAVFSVSPALTGTPTSTTAAVDTNTTQIATTAFVLAQSAAATPLADTTAGSVGTSTRFARADHTHPAHNTFSQMRFGAGNLNPMTQGATWYFSQQAAAGEGVEQTPVSQSGTFDKMYCSSSAAPGGAAQTFTITFRKNTADTTLTCTMSTGGASTCNDTTHSVSVVAGDLVNMKNVTSATSGTANGMNCGLRFTTTSP